MRNARIIDLDGSVAGQSALRARLNADDIPALEWGPRIRLACSFGTYTKFEGFLNERLASHNPALTLYGSGDFHHVTLALLKRLQEPFNLLVLDKHPDWMKGIPFLHCGTWLRHALRLPNLRRVFHCGGALDFDNGYRVLAPWKELQAGRVVVFPARDLFVKGQWASVTNQPLFASDLQGEEITLDLGPFADDLARYPLYLSIDKDVLVPDEAAVNWDSGFLRVTQATAIIEAFITAAKGRVVGADLLGDWSEIRLGHWLSRLLDKIDHPSPHYSQHEANMINERTNLSLVEVVQKLTT